MKRNCKGTLNVLFKKKIKDDKKFNLKNNFFISNQNFTAKHVKVVKNTRFFKAFCSKFHIFPGYFCLNCQISGFSRFPGKVATLLNRFIMTLKCFNSY